MKLKKDSSEQKLRGAYYTPLKLADAIVKLFASQNIFTVLEPSCGDGVFLDSLKNQKILNKVDKLTAVEIEIDESEKVRNRYLDFKQVEVCTEDFFDYYNRVLGKKCFDLILRATPRSRHPGWCTFPSRPLYPGRRTRPGPGRCPARRSPARCAGGTRQRNPGTPPGRCPSHCAGFPQTAGCCSPLPAGRSAAPWRHGAHLSAYGTPLPGGRLARSG